MQGILLPSCAIVFSILLCIVFFSKKRVDNLETKIYAIILVAILCDSIFAWLLQVIAYQHVFNSFTLTLISIINRLDFISLIIYSTCLFLYTIVITKNPTRNKIKNIKNMLIMIDIIAVIISMALNIRVINESDNYSITGGAAIITFIICGTYIMLSIFYVLRNIKNADKRYIPIIMTVFIIALLLITYLVNPYLVVISITLTFINYVMFHTIENPDIKMIEELNIARDQADKANRAKSDFLSSMSHEIRTPLNAIVGLSEDNLRYSDTLPERVKENSNDIISASKTLLEIVGNILDINKIESGKLEITNEEYNPREVIETLARIDAIRIGEKPIAFKIDIAEDLPYELIGDRIHIKEIVNNLLSNAIKYTEKGEINLRVKCINNNDDCTLIISVQDTGRGIKAENIHKLFNKFERLDIEKNTTMEGTGLGLAITKKIVDMMGGKINVESDFGKGSIFMVTLPQKIKNMVNPLTNTQVIKLNEIKMQELKSVTYKNKKLLIVDDNKLNIKVARRALDEFQFNIEECYDGLECLDKINSGNTYDLILMDIMMPNMNGEVCISKLKEIENFNTPVIALTADAVSGAREHYMSLGFTDYVAKPFSRDQIKDKIDKILSNKTDKNLLKEVSVHATVNEKEISDKI